jgi:hypothetical protein
MRLKYTKLSLFTEQETDINEYVNGDITIWNGENIGEFLKYN